MATFSFSVDDGCYEGGDEIIDDKVPKDGLLPKAAETYEQRLGSVEELNEKRNLNNQEDSIHSKKSMTYSNIGLLQSNRPFRLYISAYVITITGEWLTYVASMELIEHILGASSQSSRIYISILHVTRVLPHFFLIPISGVLADTWDRRKSMIALDILGALAPLFYALALYFQSIEIVFIVSLVQASIAAMYEPCRSAILPLMVIDDQDMKKATVLTGLVWSAMTAIGSGLGGLLVSLVGMKTCFVLDSISFLFSAMLLYGIGGDWGVSSAQDLQHFSIWRKIKDMATNGVKYILASTFWPIVFIKFTTTLVFGGFDTLNVCFSESYTGTTDIEQAQMLGALFFSVGFGCVIGPMIAEPFTPISKPRSLLNACVVAFGLQAVGDIGMGYFRSFNVKLLFSAMRASGSSIAWIDSQVLLQFVVDDSMLGRVTALEYGSALLAEGISAIATGFIIDEYGFTAKYTSIMIGIISFIFFLIWLCYSCLASDAAFEKDSSFTEGSKVVKNNKNILSERSRLLANEA